MTDLLIRYLHFLGIIVFASMLVAEHILVKDRLSAASLKKVARIDAVYGVSALVVFGAGLALWLWVGKPAAFYSSNPLFHVKVTAFVLMALLSIRPTLFYLKHRHTDAESVAIPRSLVHLLRAQALLLVLIPLLAVLMARGVGR